MDKLNELLGPETLDMLQQEMGDVVQTVQALSYKEMRPWGEFFSSFKVPSQWDVKHIIDQRMTTNLIHFRSNYLCLCAVILSLKIIFNPFLLVSLILVALMCIFGIFVVKQPIMVGDFAIDFQKRIYLCIGSSLLLMTLTGALEALLWSFVLCCFVCGAHMVAHTRSMMAQVHRTQEEWGAGQGFFGMFSSSGSSVSSSSNSYTSSSGHGYSPSADAEGDVEGGGSSNTNEQSSGYSSVANSNVQSTSGAAPNLRQRSSPPVFRAYN